MGESQRFYRSRLDQKKDYNIVVLAERNRKGFLYCNLFSTMAHTTHDCTYHIVFCPKYRKKIIYGKFKTQLWNILTEILRQMKIEKIEWHLSKNHIHLQLRIPPSLAVSSVVWKLKWKSAITLYNRHSTRRTATGNKHFWSRWFFVRTNGLDIDMINNYIRNQETEDIYEDWNQLDMDF